MKLSYTLTFDDHAAAHRLFRKAAPGEGPGLAERLLFLWLLLGAVGLLVVVMVASAVIDAATPANGEAILGWAVGIVLPLVPSLIILGLLWYGVASSMPSTERRAMRRFVLSLTGMLLVVNVINTALTGPVTRPAKPTPAAAPAADDGSSSLALLPWLVIFLAIWMFISRFLRGAVRRSWDAQPNLRRPQTLHVTPHGLRFDIGVAVLDYRWECFLKWREGETLFLLYPSDIGFFTVPKRAMPDAATVDAFRQLLWQHVRPIDPAPLGFPLPAAPSSPATPPPLPASY